jgi:hypothetical protein
MRLPSDGKDFLLNYIARQPGSELFAALAVTKDPLHLRNADHAPL